MSKPPISIDPLDVKDNVLPNFPLLVKLLGFAHRFPATHVAIKDNISGFEASHLKLLNDVLAVRLTLYESLSRDTREDLHNGKHTFFMVLAGPGYDYAVSFLAILALGGVIVPVSPHVPLQEAIYFARKSTAAGVVYHHEFSHIVREVQREIRGSFTAIETSRSLGTNDLSPSQIYVHSRWSLATHDPGLVIFTSGTTGRPKAVVLPREILSAGSLALSEHFELSHKDVALHCMPVHHIAGISVCFVPFLWSGARLEFEPFNVKRVWERWKSGGTTVFGGVPTMYTRLMRYYEDTLRPSPSAPEYVQGLRQLRFLMSGTSALPSPLRSKWTALTDGKRILERYGASEFGTAILTPLHGSLCVPDGSVGVSLSGCDVKLATEPEGEILVKCPGMLLGYHQDPEATKTAFDDSGYFKTGDIGRCDGRYWFIKGRASMDIIKSGGYKISSLDIEREILGLEYISEVSVLGVADEEYGQRVAAVVILRDIDSLSLADLRDALRASLSGYKLPTLLYVAQDLPKTVSGKVQKIALRNEVFDSGKYNDDIQRFSPPTAHSIRPRL